MILTIRNIYNNDFILCLVIVIDRVVPVICNPCVLEASKRRASFVLEIFIHLLPPIAVRQGITRQGTLHHIKEVVPICATAPLPENVRLRVSHPAVVDVADETLLVSIPGSTTVAPHGIPPS